MKAEAQSKGVRLTLSAAEARFVALALEELATPVLTPIAATIRRALVQVDARQSDARARRAAARARKAAAPSYRYVDVDGHRVSATQADWYDASRDVDRHNWQRIRPDEPWQSIPDQVEIRRAWWMIFVFSPAGDIVDTALIETFDALQATARRLIAAAQSDAG